jgi:uncharacterized protein (DUF302 family)
MYYKNKKINKNFEQTELAVREELSNVGFGILTEISVNEVFKKKLDIDFKKYKILGACNPHFAHKAITSEEMIGTLLPCNVLLIERDNGTEVAIMNPSSAMSVVNNESITPLANEVESLLNQFLDKL